MRAGDESFERLRAALEQLASDDVAELVAEARAQARSRVRTMLTEAMAQTMLERAREELEGARPSVPSGPAEPSPPVHHEPGLGWYVYCVTAADGLAIPAVSGIDPAHDVTALHDGDLAAIVSRVPLEEFDEDRLREHLADMTWLERTARRHEEVLDTVRALRTVIPMRLCSIYRDESGIRAMLERESSALKDALDSLDGKAEWGVKVFLAAATPDIPRDDGEQRAATGPEADTGAAYMERRRQEHHERRRAGQRFEAACTSIHERLSAIAAEALIAAPQRSEASGHAGEMILNGVYLVQDSDRERFDAVVAALRAEFEPLGLELEQTGPWPAYNFVPGTIGAAW